MNKDYLISYDYIQNPIVLSDFNIHQIGRIFGNENTYYENHYHSDFYELTIVKKGEGILYANNKPIPIKEGDIYLSCLRDIHAIRSSKDNPIQYDFCAFYPTNEKLLLELNNLSSSLYPEETRLFHSEHISNLLPYAINEMQNLNENHSLEILNSIFIQIVVYLMRKLSHKNYPVFESVPNKTVLCYKIMDYITSNLEKINSLSELTDVFHLSYNHLTTLFKKNTSMTLVNFYNMQRLSIAEKYILEKTLTLEQIAQKLNYSTAYTLSKAFKKRYKLSPKAYRLAKHKNNQDYANTL